MVAKPGVARRLLRGAGGRREVEQARRGVLRMAPVAAVQG